MARAPEARPGRARGAVTLLAGALVLALPARADMISTEGMEPWETCGLCHGYTGLSATAKFPRLAGQKAAYIEKQLRDVREGRRTNDGGQMRNIVTEVAPEDFARIAEWFAGQEAPAPDAPDGDAEAGAALFADLGCAGCHGAGAEPPAGLVPPHLYAQHERYLAKQLADFRDGRRTNDPDGVMQARAADLSDAEIAALAAYLASTERP